MKYKVGDKVRIKSLEWYKENRDISGDIAIGDTFFRDFMLQFCGSVVTIESIELVANLMCYRIKEDGRHYCWVDEMIEGLVEEETTNVMDEDKMLIGWIKEPNRYRLVPDKDYEIKYDEKGFFYLEKKKKEYPKTYGYCCDTLECCSYNVGFDRCETSYDDTLHNKLLALRKLIICRDTYWKIAGEEMGLGKPWKPDWRDGTYKYCVYFNGEEVICTIFSKGKCILAFPTEEMRDAFYENFKELIESCKELL